MSSVSDDFHLDIDNILDRLLNGLRNKMHISPSSDKFTQISEEEMIHLCNKSKEIFLRESILLELEAPIKLLSNIRGHYSGLLCHFECSGFPPDSKYLFLGNYVDTGRQSLETICLLFAYKIKYPNRIFLLRGSHESRLINRIYGFYDECKRRYSIKLWKLFNSCFDCLPVVAIINSRIFCCHGGLSPELNSLEQIRQIQRPIDIPDTGLLCDLLWSDPDNSVKNWNENVAGVSYTFGVNIVKEFLNRHNLDLICRGHQFVENGYEFFADRRLVTVFSTPDYCGTLDNAGVLLSIDENLICAFKFVPSSKKQVDEKHHENLERSSPIRSGNYSIGSSLSIQLDVSQKYVSWADIDSDASSRESTLYDLYKEL